MRLKLTHARFDPAYCLAPGLFRSLKKGKRIHTKLDVVYDYGNVQLQFKGPEPLGVNDLRVLQGLIAMAGPFGTVLNVRPKTEAGQHARQLLELKGDAELDSAIVVKDSYYALAREIGYEDLDQTILIRQCIERLWTVSIMVVSQGKRYGYRLLSQYSSDEGIGHLYVALNPRIACAILGPANYAYINMLEVRRLKSDPARLLHHRLCGFIRPGESRQISIDTLCQYAWPDAASTAAAQRKRQQRVRQAIEELRQLGWKCEEVMHGRVRITRASTKAGPSVEQPSVTTQAHEVNGSN